MSAAMRQFNKVIGLFDFILTRNQFLNRLKLTLQTYPTLRLPQDKLCTPHDADLCILSLLINILSGRGRRFINSFSDRNYHLLYVL
jgi:hypothetical protein